MKNELIHVKFGHEEARQSQKDVLSLEMNLLKILKVIKKYHPIRSEELKTKLKLHRKLKEVITNMGRLQTTLPKLKIPEILKKEHEEDKKLHEPKIKEIKKEKYDEGLESQLQEIQDRLNKLQR